VRTFSSAPSTYVLSSTWQIKVSLIQNNRQNYSFLDFNIYVIK
jgi:hypothetical protein